ncbi:DUF3658 domain-containing protein [Bacillus licheniformis]
MNDEKLRFIYEQGDQTALTASERRRLAEEWTALSQQTSVLRVWDDGRIKSVKEDFYDSFIIGKLAQLQKTVQPTPLSTVPAWSARSLAIWKKTSEMNISSTVF